jgi:hypothetical protein
MSHTPGPWTVDGNVVRTEFGGQVCMVSRWIRQTREEKDANLNLIALAPVMLNALRECISEPGAACFSSPDYMRRRLNYISGIARDILNTATGD